MKPITTSFSNNNKFSITHYLTLFCVFFTLFCPDKAQNIISVIGILSFGILHGANDIKILVKKNSTSKFDESIDFSLRINLKQSKVGDLSLRTVVKLPNGSGKKSKIAVLCESSKVEEAKKSGAEVVGFASLIDRSNGKSKINKKIISQVQIEIPTFTEENIPEKLKRIKATKPGSRDL